MAEHVTPLEIQTLGDVLRLQQRDRPQAVAISFQGTHIAYGELWQRAARVANALLAMGAAKGSRVAYCGRNDAAYFELLFGCALLGAVLVPVNWRLAGAEVGYVLGDARTVALVVDTEFTEAIAAARTAAVPVITIGDASGSPAYSTWRDAASDSDPGLPVDLDDVAVQMYTSGTTGRPKGAMLSHRAINVVRTRQPGDWARWTADDVCLISMPLFHIGGTGTALASLYFGARMVVVRDFEASEFIRLIRSEQVTRLFLVPAAIQMLLQHPDAAGADFRRVRYISYGSSPMLQPLLAKAMAVFDCGFVQVYGLTESSGTVVANPVARGDLPQPERLRSVGQAIAGVALAIRAPDGAMLPAGQAGEVIVRSASNMAGYWNLPEATAEAFLDGGWLRTGDVGYLDADGFLYLVDRLKDMIVSGGENVYPVEVEAALLQIPGIREAAVIGVPDAKWGEAVKAVVVPEAGAALDEKSILAAARRGLAGYKLPKSVELRDSLPRNAAGKVLRRELREPYWRGTDRRI